MMFYFIGIIKFWITKKLLQKLYFFHIDNSKKKIISLVNLIDNTYISIL